MSVALARRLLPVLLLAAWAGSATAETTLTVGLQEDPDTLDPAINLTFVGRHVLDPVCDGLFALAPDLTFQPRLALSSDTSPDGRTMTLKLRPNVRFHDGEPFDAAAVKANLERYLTLPESRRKTDIAAIDSVEAIDPLTVAIHLKGPFAPLLAEFAARSGMMASPKAFREAGAAFGNRLTCAGPYKFVERVAQDRVVLERFADYWDKDAAKIDRILFRTLPEPTVRLANLRAGAIDVAERLAPTDVSAAQADPRVKVVSVGGIGYDGITFNLSPGAGHNSDFARLPALREAFDLALDRQALNQVAFAGAYAPGNQPLAPSSPYRNADRPVLGQDLAKARALVKASGVASPTLTLMVINTSDSLQIAQILQAMVKEAGIDLKLQAIEFNTLIAQQNKGDFEASLIAWSGRVDPDGNIYPLLGCPSPSNVGHYCRPEVEALFIKGRTTSDPTARKAIYAEAMAKLIDDRPIIYLLHRSYIFGLGARVQGFVPYPDGVLRLRDVKLAP